MVMPLLMIGLVFGVGQYQIQGESPFLSAGKKSLSGAKDLYQKGEWEKCILQGEEARTLFQKLQDLCRVQNLSAQLQEASNYVLECDELIKKAQALVTTGKPRVEPSDPLFRSGPTAGPLVGSPDKPSTMAVKRIPEPSLTEQKQAEKIVQEIFKAELANRTLSDVQKILKQARDTNDDPAGIYVLFREARDMALQLGNIPVAFGIEDEMSERFQVDALGFKTAVLLKANVPLSIGLARVLATSAVVLSHQIISAGNIDQANSILVKAEAFAKASQINALITTVSTRRKEMKEIQNLHRQLKSAEKTLAEKPSDPSANLTVGWLACSLRANWEYGLPLLAKGTDSVLKALAEKELVLPSTVEAQMGVADGWWELAAKERIAFCKINLQERAILWYRQAATKAEGLKLAKISKRLKEADAERSTETGEKATEAVELLARIDPDKDAIRGAWSMQGEALVSRPPPWSQLRIPYQAPQEYDLTIEAERIDGTDALVVGLAHGDRRFCAVFDGFSSMGQPSTGLEQVDFKGNRWNETTRLGAVFTNYKKSTVKCSVRNTGITVSVDGTTVIDWRGIFARLSPNLMYEYPGSDGLYIAMWNSFRIWKVSISPVTGHGKLLR